MFRCQSKIPSNFSSFALTAESGFRIAFAFWKCFQNSEVLSEIREPQIESLCASPIVTHLKSTSCLKSLRFGMTTACFANEGVCCLVGARFSLLTKNSLISSFQIGETRFIAYCIRSSIWLVEECSRLDLRFSEEPSFNLILENSSFINLWSGVPCSVALF